MKKIAITIFFNFLSFACLFAQETIQKVIFSCDLWDRNNYELIESCVDTINYVDRFIDADHFYMKQINVNKSISSDRLDINLYRLSKTERVYGTHSDLVSLVRYVLDIQPDFFDSYSSEKSALVITSDIKKSSSNDQKEIFNKILSLQTVNSIDSMHLENIFNSPEYSSDLVLDFQFPKVSNKFFVFLDYEKYRNRYFNFSDSVEIYFTIVSCNKWNRFTSNSRKVSNRISRYVTHFSIIPFDELPNKIKIDKDLIFNKKNIKNVNFILYPRYYSYAISG